jgi:ActR/RegA family two-component response regulator
MLRREYHPAAEPVAGAADRQLTAFQDGTLSLEELCRLYCTHVYTSAGSYIETARRLKIDRRTVKRYVEAKKTVIR